ncbi:hypothetical protein FPY71_15045 [Aureimonas fodinaquatilis]|uniref:Uncharacterized protein n=1 Tax=Aureimonas fodinaquatilis TaxID=2565783 RepID=A0A5B0DSZ6_9HYPH|nr:hypothetical protein [Aureimonas fodinaquatilis]KAA0968881.1 hypothetical protein FPY71_15045 [Aureimonas fodinaquatilis]
MTETPSGMAHTINDPTGWRVWRIISIVLIAIPAILALMWGVAFAIVRVFIPGCQIGPSNGTCVTGGIDLEAPLAILSMPAMIFAFIAPYWAMLILGWILYGLLPAIVWWLWGRGFTLHPAFMLQGQSMRVPRRILAATMILLYGWWWVATL